MKQINKTTTALAAIAAAAMITPQAADAALAAHWTFDEGAGTTAADSSGNGYTVTESISGGTWITGKSGSAIDEGHYSVDGHTTGAASQALNFAGGSVTVSLWITDPTSTGFGGIAGFESRGSGSDIYGFKHGGDTLNWTAVGTSPLTAPDTLANYSAATSDGWIHIVGTYDGVTGASTMYVNGTQVATETEAAGIPDKTPPSIFVIGRYSNDTTEQFTGAIDDLQVYDEALSATDVSSLFANPGLDLASIPEPSSTALLGLGGLALIFRRRK
ncbi:MAG: LamG domain-containing protein [Akkermansiaceae bacterium]